MTHNGASNPTRLTLILSVNDHRSLNRGTWVNFSKFCTIFSFIHRKFQPKKVVKFRNKFIWMLTDGKVHWISLRWLFYMQNISIQISHHRRIASFSSNFSYFFLSYPFKHFSFFIINTKRDSLRLRCNSVLERSIQFAFRPRRINIAFWERER